MENDTKFAWFFNTSGIELGGSSVLGGNYFVFYMIHGVAISLIVTSLISSAIVIVSILWASCRLEEVNQSKRPRMEFSDRFPLYLAVADCLWSISHLVDHLYLVITLRYPINPHVSTFLSINLWTFLGYQQLMHAGLAIYTFLRVVRGIDVNLGKMEWKLHATCGVLIAVSIALFHPLEGFGPSGYWMLQDVRTQGGIILGWYITASSSTQALCTTLGYRQIKKVVEKQKSALMKHKKISKAEDRHSTASECLTTFVIISLAMYCPLAIIYLAFVVESMFGVIEPFTALLVVISANSSGWGNALGYWYNLRIKAERQRLKEEKLIMVTTSTGGLSSISSKY